MPTLTRIDHIHIYAPDRPDAERWYRDVLGFERVQEFASWSTGGGPLVLENGGAHVALFEAAVRPSTTVAFAVDAANYAQWKAQLARHGVAFSESDHELAWSIYFEDPYGTPYEITSYEHEQIRNDGAPG